ncbi:MAG: peptidylprolyl isomerase [Anaerolineales bacterium]|nr:peptidylprolyl isomerase [Anaerolineales bacterium]MDW8277306.1 peptidylprolyl isomerase [Anaerolineales bacterium]
MRKLFFWLCGLLILLTSCATPAAPPAPTGTPVPLSQPQVSPTAERLCVDARQPTPAAAQASLFPPVSETQDVIRGQPDAAVTVVMYGDFQCADCARIAAALEQIRVKYPAELRVVYRHYPLVTRYDKALLTLQSAEAARLQGKFWEMHDLLFARQSQWSAMPPEEFRLWVRTQASTLALDTAQFERDLNSDAVRDAVVRATQTSQQFGQLPLPLLLINGEIIKNPYVLVNLEQLIHLYALPARQFSTCPPFVLDLQKSYTATLQTSQGAVRLRLFPEKTPNTVNNFVFLAEQGWYDNVPFHQVVPGSLVITGDPSGTGMGNPGYFIPDEILPTLKFDRAGLVAMFNVGPGSNGSQFFITLAPRPDFDGRYTIFGEVIEGLALLNRFAARNFGLNVEGQAAEMLITVEIEAR